MFLRRQLASTRQHNVRSWLRRSTPTSGETKAKWVSGEVLHVLLPNKAKAHYGVKHSGTRSSRVRKHLMVAVSSWQVRRGASTLPRKRGGVCGCPNEQA